VLHIAFRPSPASPFLKRDTPIRKAPLLLSDKADEDRRNCLDRQNCLLKKYERCVVDPPNWTTLKVQVQSVQERGITHDQATNVYTWIQSAVGSRRTDRRQKPCRNLSRAKTQTAVPGAATAIKPPIPPQQILAHRRKRGLRTPPGRSCAHSFIRSIFVDSSALDQHRRFRPVRLTRLAPGMRYTRT
jgi:hypothetical protein